MLAQRWSRWIPGRSRLMLILGIAIVSGLVFVFVDLALARSSMLARYQQAEARVEQLTIRKLELEQELLRAQQGQNLPQQAYEQFGMAPAGAGVIVGQGESAPVAPPASDKAPFWRKWLRGLGLP